MPREGGDRGGRPGTIRVTAGALALAVVAAVFQSIQSDQLDQHPGDAAGAFATALADSTWVLVGLVAIGAVLTWALVRRTGDEGHPEPEEHPEHPTESRRLHL
jgi:hypothetical protein